MKNLSQLDRWRNVKWEVDKMGHRGNDVQGMFQIKSPVDAQILNIIATKGCGWEHVSISRGDRTATWREMETIKRHFFNDDEMVIQIHPPLNDYIDGQYPGGNAKFTLHLWRCYDREMIRPPLWMVGARSKEEKEEFEKIGTQAILDYGDV